MGIDNKKLPNIDWGEYFISIVSVCPWSLAYWTKQKIDVIRWRGESNIVELGDYVARMWIHPNASARRLSDIHHGLIKVDYMRSGYTHIIYLETTAHQCLY